MKCSTQIYLELNFAIVHTLPDICVRVDNEVIVSGPQRHKLGLDIDLELEPGMHRLWVHFLNKNYKESTPTSDMAVIIDRVLFQHLDHDFKIYSRYCPNYPQPWLSQQTQPLETEIHGNYLGWSGQWYLEFETPIYRWIHQRLNLGWLL